MFVSTACKNTYTSAQYEHDILVLVNSVKPTDCNYLVCRQVIMNAVSYFSDIKLYHSLAQRSVY